MDAIEVVGVYHANGGVLGEIAYVFGKILGQTECALCDVTHGLLFEKSAINRGDVVCRIRSVLST